MTTDHTVIHGIKQCDTCRKALAWLTANQVPHRFFDLRADPLSTAMIETWLEQLSTLTLLNRRSTTWRQLTDQEKASENVVALLLANPTLIKRPLLSHQGHYRIGFKAEEWATFLGIGA